MTVKCAVNIFTIYNKEQYAGVQTVHIKSVVVHDVHCWFKIRIYILVFLKLYSKSSLQTYTK